MDLHSNEVRRSFHLWTHAFNKMDSCFTIISSVNVRLNYKCQSVVLYLKNGTATATATGNCNHWRCVHSCCWWRWIMCKKSFNLQILPRMMRHSPILQFLQPKFPLSCPVLYQMRGRVFLLNLIMSWASCLLLLKELSRVLIVCSCKFFITSNLTKPTRTRFSKLVKFLHISQQM